MAEAKRRPDCPKWCKGHPTTDICLSEPHVFADGRCRVALVQDRTVKWDELEPRLHVHTPGKSLGFTLELDKAAGLADMFEAMGQADIAEAVRELAAAAVAE